MEDTFNNTTTSSFIKIVDIYSRGDGNRDITNIENSKNVEDRGYGFLVFCQVNRWLSNVFRTFDGPDLLLMATNYSKDFKVSY